VFVDETGASTKMTRLYGRCPRGKRRGFAQQGFELGETTARSG
jgi:hypothetical protein